MVPRARAYGGAAYNPRTDSWRRIPSERRPQRSGDHGLRRERDPRARRAAKHAVLVQPVEQPLAAIAADGARRRRPRRCLDWEPPPRVGLDDERIRTGYQRLEELSRPLRWGLVKELRVCGPGASCSSGAVWFRRLRVHRLSRGTSLTERRSARRGTHRRLLSAASSQDTISSEDPCRLRAARTFLCALNAQRNGGERIRTSEG